jgi:hypothetical protein
MGMRFFKPLPTDGLDFKPEHEYPHSSAIIDSGPMNSEDIQKLIAKIVENMSILMTSSYG